METQVRTRNHADNKVVSDAFRQARVEHRLLQLRHFSSGIRPCVVRAAREVGCAMMLIRPTSLLERRCVPEESPMVAGRLFEAAELILAAQRTKLREAVMVMR
jgi:hypothetical protein